MEKLGINAEKADIPESVEILKDYGILRKNNGKYEFVVDAKFIEEMLKSHEIYRGFI